LKKTVPPLKTGVREMREKKAEEITLYFIGDM